MGLHCTIITEGHGSPHRYYQSREGALKAAIRHHAQTGESVEVAWCRERDNPKVWLAFVTAEGVTKTEYWISEAEEK